MKLAAPTRSDRPTPEVARMYARVVSAWACDALRLRRSGLDRPVSRAWGAWGAVGIGNGLAPRAARKAG